MSAGAHAPILAGRYGGELLFHGVLLLAGLIPLIGFAICGAWSDGELGFSTVIAIFTAREIGKIVLAIQSDRRSPS